jgi:hypothetical protein
VVETHSIVKCVSQLLLDAVQSLHRGARLQLQLEESLVAVINVLNELFVFNLQLMEVNELKIVTHLVFVLNLGLSLEDLALERVVFALEFVDELLFLLEFIKHVLGQLLGVVLSNATVLCRGQETAEVESLLSNFGNTQIGALQNGLESLEKRFGFVTSLLNVSFKRLQLSGGNLVLLFGGKLGRLVTKALFDQLSVGVGLLVGATVEFLLTE